MVPIFATLVEGDMRSPAFKTALRAADAGELTRAMEYLMGTEGNGRRLGRLRAALRRRASRDKK